MRCHFGMLPLSVIPRPSSNCSLLGESAQHVCANLSTNSLINSESASFGSNCVSFSITSNCSRVISSSVPSSLIITTVVEAEAETSASSNSSHAFKHATPSLDDQAMMFARAIRAVWTAISISLSRDRFKHSLASARNDFSAANLLLLLRNTCCLLPLYEGDPPSDPAREPAREPRLENVAAGDDGSESKTFVPESQVSIVSSKCSVARTCQERKHASQNLASILYRFCGESESDRTAK
mmetsp:Transcript_10515/g.30011  ORF Transcript_10515/g.30011 Transcript_10515/m.30011 type:complete len:239 (+) Transcript_10515:1637-2353(+)